MLIATKTQIQNIKTMSSREIAELCKKEHKNVLRVIRELIDAQILVAQIEPLKFEYRGQQFDYYELNKRDSMVVVARLSPEFMAAVVDRWQELEAQVAKPVFIVPQSLPQALRLAADLAEEKALLEAKVQADAPKVQFHDHVTEAVNCQSIEQVAKVLGTGRNRLFAWLRQQKILLPSNEPYQTYIDRGYFRVIEKQYNDKSHGDSHTYTRTLITGKGFTFIQKRFMEVAA